MMDGKGEKPTKREAVGLILDEMKKIIHEALDKGEGQDMTPLELIASLTQQLCFEALKMEMENMDDPEDDSKGGTTH